MKKSELRKVIREELLREKKFDSKKLAKLVDNAFKEIWKGFNTLDAIIPNYLDKVGQGGAKSAWRKQFSGLQNAIEKADRNFGNIGESKEDSK